MGLGESVQKLFYLPEAHTDFLFAVLAEELGLVGVRADARRCSSRSSGAVSTSRASPPMAGLKFQAYLAAGFGLWIGIQAFINIGVNMGVLPTKGLTLPLMSYGALEPDRGAGLGRPAAARVSRGDAASAARHARRRVPREDA